MLDDAMAALAEGAPGRRLRGTDGLRELVRELRPDPAPSGPPARGRSRTAHRC
ncbi:hypothetical protein [Streptomyces sp. NPDC020607]|uniref:hypothetical protein n=1 Tax=Streptomyces sp. NPDC020607 TaxID=3365082 RepID=UPI0037B0D8D4